jgi:hypothetical protein
MWLRLRQIALVANDIEQVVGDLKSVFGLEVGFQDPDIKVYGLQNRLLPVGTQFLEVVSPIQENTAGGRYMQYRGGDSGYMVITQCDDHPPRKRHVEALGIRKVAEQDAETFCILQLHPKDTGGSFLEIDWHTGADDPVPPWSHAAGTNWQKAVHTDVVSAISAAEIQSPDPEKVASRWSEIVQIPAQRSNGGMEIRLDNATLRFVPATDGRGEGLGGVDLKSVDRQRLLSSARERGLLKEGDVVLIGGVRFRPV